MKKLLIFRQNVICPPANRLHIKELLSILQTASSCSRYTTFPLFGSRFHRQNFSIPNALRYLCTISHIRSRLVLMRTSRKTYLIIIIIIIIIIIQYKKYYNLLINYKLRFFSQKTIKYILYKYLKIITKRRLYHLQNPVNGLGPFRVLVAQLVEHPPGVRKVTGSKPIGTRILFFPSLCMFELFL